MPYKDPDKQKEWYTEYNQRPEVKERIRKHQQTPEYKEHRRLYSLKKRKNMSEEDYEKQREKDRLYYQNNKEKILLRCKKQYEKHKEKFCLQKKIYYKENREKLIERQHIYRNNNLEKCKDRVNKYQRSIKHIKKYTDITTVFLNMRISGMKSRSKDVTLTAEELLELIPKDLKCPVFGTKFTFGKGDDWKHKQKALSVDRIDNNKGYHKDNIVVVSLKANTMKSSATLKELYRVADFYYKLEKKVG